MSVDLTTADGVAHLTLDRPPVNALDLETVERLRTLFAGLAAQPPLGLVIRGAGRCFCAGVDTRAFTAYSRDDRARMVLAISAMVTELYALPCPVVSAVGGHALGGGFVLMLGADVGLAADDAQIKLGLTEAQAGVPFPAGPLEVIRAELSPELLRRLTLTSQTLPPQALHGLGVIDELCDAANLNTRAEARVRELASQPGHRLVKAQVRGATIAKLRAIVASAEDPLIEQLDAQSSRR
jgi:enoyl-CoA hydratase